MATIRSQSNLRAPKHVPIITAKEKVDTFRKEILKIKSSEIKTFTAGVLKGIPDYFFVLPATSSGRHHNVMDNARGGLVHHTKAVVIALDTLLSINVYRDMITNDDESIDAMYSACILHDIAKYGFDYRPSKHTLFQHPIMGAEHIQKYANTHKYTQPWVDQIVRNVMTHHGQWNTSRYYTGITLPTPVNNSDILVHTADYLASREYIQIVEGGWI